MLIDVGRGWWINSDKILVVIVRETEIDIALEGNQSVVLKGEDREAFLRLMNKAAPFGKPFPEVS